MTGGGACTARKRRTEGTLPPACGRASGPALCRGFSRSAVEAIGGIKGPKLIRIHVEKPRKSRKNEEPQIRSEIASFVDLRLFATFMAFSRLYIRINVTGLLESNNSVNSNLSSLMWWA